MPLQAFSSRGRSQRRRELGRQGRNPLSDGLTPTFPRSDAAVKQILLQLDENAGRRRFIIADLDETHVLISPDAVERVRVVSSRLYDLCCRRRLTPLVLLRSWKMLSKPTTGIRWL